MTEFIDELSVFKGRKLNDVLDEIERIAFACGLSVNVTDPEFNPGNIDKELGRLNVHTDREGVVTSFTVG